MASRNYRDLIVWQKAMELVEAVYRVAKQLPDGERYGLVTQIQRAAVSIPSNIAEGQGRDSNNEFLRFLSIANGSRCELETQIMLASRLSYLDDNTRDEVLGRSEEVGRLLRGLAKSITQP